MRALVGIDLRATEHDWLVERAAVYAERLGATIDFAYFSSGEPEDPAHRARLDALLQQLAPAARGRSVVDAQAPAEGLVAIGRAYELIVVGSREPLAIDRLIRGPMAARVLRTAVTPVLVPRGERAPMPNPRLLVGVDVEGPAPTAVLRWADRWAGHLQGTVHVMYAAQAHRGDFAQTKDAITAKLTGWLGAHIGEGRRGNAVVRRGDPEEVLVQTSADYDLLLVGNRDREGLARIVLGAVAGTIVRRAQCDVISLPTATAPLPA